MKLGEASFEIVNHLRILQQVVCGVWDCGAEALQSQSDLKRAVWTRVDVQRSDVLTSYQAQICHMEAHTRGP